MANYFRNFFWLVVLTLFLGCSDKEQHMSEDFHKVYDTDGGDIKSMLEKVSEKNIYFGHQSVGRNILAGLDYWTEETNILLEVVTSRDFSGINSPSLIHFYVGENGNPSLKVDDFSNLVAEIPNDSNAIAFFKFCYADILRGTDVESTFTYFKDKMLDLQKNFPNIKIVLVTVPYTTIQKGLKAIIKKVLFMPVSGKIDNIRRSEFNDKMNEELGNIFPIFDLGLVETILPDGTKSTYTYKGETYPVLPDMYSSDHGHLNAVGSQIVAYNLISFLSNVIGE